MMDKLSFEEFIYQVKHELLDAQKKHEGEFSYFELQKVELEVTLAVNRTGKGKVNIYVAELGANVAKELTHVVKLAFDIVPYSESEESDINSANSKIGEAKRGRISYGGGPRVGRGTKKYR